MTTRFLVLLAILSVFYGCATTGYPPSAEKVFLGPAPEFETLKSFRKIVQEEPGTPAFEKARIDYLLERLSKSPYNFYRNNVKYSNLRAVLHLRWKYFHHRKEVQTAEDFIRRIASRSSVSGQNYLIEIDPENQYPMDEVLLNELGLLNKGVESYHSSLLKEASRPAPGKLPGGAG